MQIFCENMRMHSVTQRIPQQQQITGIYKPKLFMPDCPSQINNHNNQFNNMLSLSVKIKIARDKMNNQTIKKQKSDKVLDLNNDNFCTNCIKSTNLLFFSNQNPKSVQKLKSKTNSNSNIIKNCDENLNTFCCSTPTHTCINMPTKTRKVIATSGQSKPYMCTTTNATFNQTKLLSSNINTNKSKNLLHINYGQEKLVYASIKNNNNNKYNHVHISKEGKKTKTTRSGKTDTRLKQQHIRIKQSIATRFKNLLISFKFCNKVGMAPISCLLILIFFLSTHSQIVKSQDIDIIPTTTTSNNIINMNEVEFNNHHMTAITNMKNLLSINLSNSNRVTNNNEVNSYKKKSNYFLTKLVATKMENYNDYKMLSENTPYGLLNNQIISESMTKNSIQPQHNYHDHIQQLQPVIDYLNSGEVEEFDSATDESSTDTDMHSDNLSKDNSLNTNDSHETLSLSAEWTRMKPIISEADNQKLLKLVIDGLGLKKLPDMRKTNISQQEYSSKYKEYVERLKYRERSANAGVHAALKSTQSDPLMEAPIQFLTIEPNITLSQEYNIRRKRDVALAGTYADYHPKSGKSNDKNSIFLHFPLNVDVSQLHPDDIEEANIKFMIIHNAALAHKSHGNKRLCHNKGSKTNGIQKHVINLKVYELTREKRIWLDGRKLEIEVDRSKADQTYNQWLELDVTKAVSKWLTSPDKNLGLEIQCSNCHRLGARILNHATDAQSKEKVDFQLMPVLNIIGRQSGKAHEMHARQLQNRDSTSNKHYHHTSAQTETSGKTECHKDNQRCCRHSMEVVFKEIQGYEFILQPKVFDAGFCRGRCPAHYHTANNHAVLQSLVWQQDPNKAPRPCCAPSKLVELEILHVDENDPEKLKISTWTDMRVVECACT